MKRLAPLLLLLPGLLPAAQAAEPVDRIFYTPAQRAQLDALRAQRTVAAAASQVRSEPAPETVTYGGIVRRSDGRATIWINDKALSESDLRSRESIVGSIGRDGQVTLQSPQSSVKLKVGQSATLISGKVEEPFTARRMPVDVVKPEAEPAKPEAAQGEPSQPATPKPAAAAKEVPPELIEALRQAAMRAGVKPPPAEAGAKAPARP